MTTSDKPERSVHLDYFGGTSGTYTGFDRFGRVIDHRWYDYDASPGDVERLTHGYDYNSNRLYRSNELNHSFDELYHADGSTNGYDGLNRLVEFRRGSLNANKDTVSSLNVAQKWALKALGNWSTFQQDANGDGSYSGTVDLDQTRTHNTANEITDISEATGQAQWATPGYDARGNMTSIPRVVTSAAYTASYDAWNRLVGLKIGVVDVAGYRYDGLGRRITKKTYNGAGSLIETRQFYHSSKDQVLEERVDGRTNPVERQYVWGLQYVDELVLRDRDADNDGTPEQRHYALQDANYNLTCLIDTNGDAQERYSYTPYGVRTVLDGSFAARGSSSFDWNIGHQGLMHEGETGLVYNRARYLNVYLGRFVQRDPIGYEDGQNTYEYVGSASTNYIDPSGTRFKDGGVVYGDEDAYWAFRNKWGVKANAGALGLTPWETAIPEVKGEDSIEVKQRKNKSCWCARVKKAKEIDLFIESFIYDKKTLANIAPRVDQGWVKGHEKKRRKVLRYAYDAYLGPVEGAGALATKCGWLCADTAQKAKGLQLTYLRRLREEAHEHYWSYVEGEQGRTGISKERPDGAYDHQVTKPPKFEPETRCEPDDKPQ